LSKDFGDLDVFIEKISLLCHSSFKHCSNLSILSFLSHIFQNILCIIPCKLRLGYIWNKFGEFEVVIFHIYWQFMMWQSIVLTVLQTLLHLIRIPFLWYFCCCAHIIYEKKKITKVVQLYNFLKYLQLLSGWVWIMPP
jgi:hypothetical protein